MLQMILAYLLGYIRIEIEGYFIERFLNIATNQKLLLWNNKRKNEITLLTNVSIREFKQIRTIAKKTKCKVRIKEKKGLPFLFYRYRKRKLFFLFLISMVLAILFSSNFIWNIEVKGAENIPGLEQEILEIANEEGLQAGAWKKKLNTKGIINEIRFKRDDIAWVGIGIKGTNTVIEVILATEKPEIVDENEYCNIVSDKTGMITKINVQNGTALVNVGDIIQERQPFGRWLCRRKIYGGKVCAC